MARSKGARKQGAALVSTLVRAEDAAEDEILEAPGGSLLAVDAAPEVSEDSEDEDAIAAKEAEIERQLVEAKLQGKEEGSKTEEARGIMNRAALQHLAEHWEMNGKKPLGWVETLDVSEQVLEEVDVNDDLKREVAFYNHAVASVRAAKAKCRKFGLAYKRPSDYFAEMLKSDAHMAKVKDKLIYEQKKISAVEERKKSQAHRRVAKEVQAEKTKQRLQQKKDMLDAVKQWKKRRSQDKGGAIRDDDDEQLEAMVNGKVTPTNKRKRSGDDGPGDRNKKPRVNRKREAKNQQYGFGGKKRGSKRNTKESANDMSQFPRNMKRSTGGKAPKPKRAGKDARNKKRMTHKR